MNRVFLGASGNRLELLSAHLLQGAPKGSPVDLGDAIVVLPSGQAVRRLVDYLAHACGGAVLLPTIVTPSALWSVLKIDPEKVPNGTTRQAAWAVSLASLADDDLALLTSVTDVDDLWRLAFGRRLDALALDLAGEGFALGDVALRLPEVADLPDREQDRWRVLAALETSFRSVLAQWGFGDACAARIAAARGDVPCALPPGSRLVLAGAVDLPRGLAQVLRRIAPSSTACIFDDESLATGYDDLGCAVRDYWTKAPIPVQPGQLRVVADAGAATDAALEAICDLAPSVANSVSVGLLDETLESLLDAQLATIGQKARAAGGRSMRGSTLFRAVSALASWLTSRDFESFAVLIRLPEVTGYLAACDESLTRGLLAASDQFQADRVAQVLHEEGALELEEHERVVAAAWQVLLKLSPSGADQLRPVAGWARAMEELVSRLGKAEGGGALQEYVRQETLKAFQKLAREWHLLPARPEVPRVTFAQALALATSELASQGVSEPPFVQGIDLVGWLELPMSEARAVVLLGFVEGRVPESVQTDPFLPDSVRSKLGLMDNAGRTARDACVFSGLVRSGKSLRLIVPRRSINGDPQWPSRLLYWCADTDVVSRVEATLAVSQPRKPARPLPPTGKESPPAISREFPIPDPLSVGDLDSYLRSPYAFYLQRVLRLQEHDDSVHAMTSLGLGNLVHDTLAEWAKLNIGREAASARDVAASLDAILDGLVEKRYGPGAWRSIELQRLALHRRLGVFAAQQADRWAAGWKIQRVEHSVAGTLNLPNGVTAAFKGRIDRVDVHANGRTCVIDYKTGSQKGIGEPDDKGQWEALQLPLYARLLQAKGEPVPDVAIWTLTDDGNKSGLESFKCEPAHLVTLDQQVADIVTRIRNYEFADVGEKPPREGTIAEMCKLLAPNDLVSDDEEDGE